MGSARALVAAVLVAVLALFVITPSDASLPSVVAKNKFLDGNVAQDRGMPTTGSVGDAEATIATLNLGRGKWLLFGSIVAAPRLLADGTDVLHWTGNITCAIIPANTLSGSNPTGNPTGRADYVHNGTVSTSNAPVQVPLTVTTTQAGAGVAKFNCTDQRGVATSKPSVLYRILQFTAVRLQGLSRASVDSP